MKQCTKCGKRKPKAAFHNRTSTGGNAAICAICDRDRVAGYRAKNASRIKKRNRDYQRKKRQHTKHAVLRKLGGVCITPGCGCRELDWLTISHEANDGKQHRIVVGSSQAVYRWALNAADAELQQARISVRCIRCNMLLAWQSEHQIKQAIDREHTRIRGET